jgi:hypothetical protein
VRLWWAGCYTGLGRGGATANGAGEDAAARAWVPASHVVASPGSFALATKVWEAVLELTRDQDPTAIKWR